MALLQTIHVKLHTLSIDACNCPADRRRRRIHFGASLSGLISVSPLEVMRQFALLLSPFAPHIGEEFWKLLGGRQSLACEPWPQYDEAFTRDATIEIPVQIIGKVRAKINVAADLDQAALEAAARADARVAELLDGKKIAKVIVGPGRLVNLVAS